MFSLAVFLVSIPRFTVWVLSWLQTAHLRKNTTATWKTAIVAKIWKRNMPKIQTSNLLHWFNDEWASFLQLLSQELDLFLSFIFFKLSQRNLKSLNGHDENCRSLNICESIIDLVCFPSTVHTKCPKIVSLIACFQGTYCSYVCKCNVRIPKCQTRMWME